MKTNKICSTFMAVTAAFSAAQAASAVTMDLLHVGNPGNPPDLRYNLDERPEGFGAVDYEYSIGKYEVTNIQWREFLNAKAAVGDPYGLYDAAMGERYGGIARSGSGTDIDPWIYTAKSGDANWDNRPVNYVDFWDAARFCNWLHNGQGTGDTESGAYVNIGDQDSFARQPDAKWWIPTEDEWYKAAYHKNDGATDHYWDYPTASDASPTNELIDPDPGNTANFRGTDPASYTIGEPYWTTEVGAFENSPSSYGTFDQGGNLWEWNETTIGERRVGRGGVWYSDAFFMEASRRLGDYPTAAYHTLGFRVATIPEPGGISLLMCAVAGGVMWRKRRR